MADQGILSTGAQIAELLCYKCTSRKGAPIRWEDACSRSSHDCRETVSEAKGIASYLGDFKISFFSQNIASE